MSIGRIPVWRAMSFLFFHAMLCKASSHNCAQDMQASAQILQCSCAAACRRHSSPQRMLTPAHALSMFIIVSSLAPLRLVATVPVAAHISAQSRFSLMHWVNCCTMGSPRHASAQDVQALRAGIALLDAINKHVVRAAFYVRVGADHLVSVHARLHVWFKSANVANAGKFL